MRALTNMVISRFSKLKIPFSLWSIIVTKSKDQSGRTDYYEKQTCHRKLKPWKNNGTYNTKNLKTYNHFWNFAKHYQNGYNRQLLKTYP